MKIFVFFLAVLLGMLASTAVADTRIVGGYDAKVGQFPYQAALRYSYNESHLCGGSILSKRWVVTAAHCTAMRTAVEILVFTGTISISGGEKYAVDKKFDHEKFSLIGLQNDIALLRTKEDIQFSKLVQPIPIRMKPVIGHKSALASGWGLISFPGSLPKTLQYLEVKTLNNEECKKRQHSDLIPFIYDGSLCIFKGPGAGKGLCYGDSGGPVAINGELVGVVSLGNPCATGYPDVLTRISMFSDWLNVTMDNNE